MQDTERGSTSRTVDENKTAEKGSPYEKLLHQVMGRCEAAGINTEIERDAYMGDNPFYDEDDPEEYAIVQMPCGREYKRYPLRTLKAIEEFVNVDFERYRCIADYTAIWSPDEDRVEAIIRSIDRVPWRSILRRLSEQGGLFGEDDEGALQLDLEEPIDGQVSVRVHPTTAPMQVLARSRVSTSSHSITIEGARVTTHDSARRVLQKYSDSLFFQIDLGMSIVLSLQRDRVPRLRRRPKGRLLTIDDLEFPSHEYDDQPMTLYWYARSAHGMPLLQFLAFYQVVEYYFPTYAMLDAAKSIRSILKDPTFRVDRDSDISRILTGMGANRGNFGDERSQLRSTINACVDPKQLYAEVTASQHHMDYFGSAKGLSPAKLQLKDENVDLRNDIADRIYNIRCRIVHSKSEYGTDQVRPLLPFTKQADQLAFEIDVLQHIAQQVLVNASSRLR